MAGTSSQRCAPRWGCKLSDVTVTVLRPGWWLPGRSLVAGQTMQLDADTAEALARRGIVRIAPKKRTRRTKEEDN